MKKNFLIGVLSVLGVMAAIGLSSQSSAAVTTNTQLGIRTGVLSFYKDTGADMNSYFSHSPNTSNTIDLGSYDPSFSITNAASSGDHRFTVNDLYGRSFYITVQSSDLNGVTTTGNIASSAVGYTGTTWYGTGKALTISPTSAVDIGSTAVNFVGRQNASGISKYSQEITLKVAIPAAQTPDTYTGTLTFTIN